MADDEPQSRPTCRVAGTGGHHVAHVSFAIPAGALADIMDKRLFLIVGEFSITITSTMFAAIVWLNLATPFNLLLFTFLTSVASTLTSPAWQSVVPQLVPKPDLSPAIAANSVGINVSRAVGPALGGVMVAQIGIAAPFWVNAFSNLGERFGSAIRTGLRHARHNSHLRATLIRAVGFFLFASAYWALLPLLTRTQIAGGPSLYGYLLGAIGASAVVSALILPRLKERLGADGLVVTGSIGTAIALVLFGFVSNWLFALAASLFAGASWIAVVATLNVSAQVALPDWVRGRGLAIFVTVFFGALSLGSVIWGEVANIVGLPTAHLLAAGGLVISVPIMWRWKLQTGAELDLTPSMHWPTPVLSHEVENDRGPVLVTVEYQIAPSDRKRFLAAVERLGRERGRDGAYAWGIFEDTAKEGRFVETFLVKSWLEHLRQHERVTNADRVLQKTIRDFLRGGEPIVTHFIAAEHGRPIG